ncbi:unnamed protein product [Lymnaea stagnalis]|uniref:Peptidase M13 C-terminal domain-containing protein n=1 Tax=Lymnaea stagnalis TaxID=6523 RepID=A0AAV2IKK1_LYMST
MNYAAFGTIVGHLLIEAFGGHHGYLAKAGFWTNGSREMFDRLSQCMVDQYNAYQIDGQNLNGTLALMHNIAYNGGVKVAYGAYKTDTNFKDLEMPGLNLTNQQIFFLGYSQLWCAKERSQSPKNYLAMDFHGSHMHRVIGALSNNVEFSKVFHCVQNKPMNPKTKCHVW